MGSCLLHCQIKGIDGKGEVCRRKKRNREIKKAILEYDARKGQKGVKKGRDGAMLSQSSNGREVRPVRIQMITNPLPSGANQTSNT